MFGHQVLPTQLIPDDQEKKILRVRLIQREGSKNYDPVYLFDEGSTISWIPCGRKLTCSFPGIKFFYGPDTYYDEEVRPILLRLCVLLCCQIVRTGGKEPVVELCLTTFEP